MNSMRIEYLRLILDERRQLMREINVVHDLHKKLLPKIKRDIQILYEKCGDNVEGYSTRDNIGSGSGGDVGTETGNATGNNVGTESGNATGDNVGTGSGNATGDSVGSEAGSVTVDSTGDSTRDNGTVDPSDEDSPPISSRLRNNQKTPNAKKRKCAQTKSQRRKRRQPSDVVETGHPMVQTGEIPDAGRSTAVLETIPIDIDEDLQTYIARMLPMKIEEIKLKLGGDEGWDDMCIKNGNLNFKKK